MAVSVTGPRRLSTDHEEVEALAAGEASEAFAYLWGLPCPSYDDRNALAGSDGVPDPGPQNRGGAGGHLAEWAVARFAATSAPVEGGSQDGRTPEAFVDASALHWELSRPAMDALLSLVGP